MGMSKKRKKKKIVRTAESDKPAQMCVYFTGR